MVYKILDANIINLFHNHLKLIDLLIKKSNITFFLFKRFDYNLKDQIIVINIKLLYLKKNGDVAQLVRVLAWQARSRGFESHLLHRFNSL
jgi:hypothetical protein